jgi:hypothetical protein
MRPLRTTGRYRKRTPVLLVDQMLAWVGHRDGDSVSTIAARLYRDPVEIRAMLWGLRS